MDKRLGAMQVCLQDAAASRDVSVQLFEAKPGDPAVPQGKAFATISAQDAGITMHPPGAGDHLYNFQDALCWTSKTCLQPCSLAVFRQICSSEMAGVEGSCMPYHAHQDALTA